MLCSLLVVAGCNKKDNQNYKADYPIYSPVKVYGTLTLTEASSLPPGADYMIIPYLDTLRIYQDGAWRNFWPVVTDDDTPTGTTVGNSLLTLTNPSAISFLRVNADNSVTALSATNFKTALSFTATDVGLGNVTNESKATMFNNPAFTGIPTAPTAAPGTNTTQISTTAFVMEAINSDDTEGDVKVSGYTVPNTIAYWNGDDSTLVSDDVVELYADSAVFTEPVFLHDTLYLAYLDIVGLAQGSVWFTNTPTGGVDSAATEPAYIGWEMDDLPTLEEYEADIKMINGHMERRVWYIDYETKELKSQYGWDGLGMMNTQSAYMIYHEITVRWMFEQNKKIAELQKVQIPSDVTNILRELNRLKFVVFALLGLFILSLTFSIIYNRK